MDANQVLKKSAQVAVATLAVLLLGALFFWRERALFLDDAFIPAHIINTGKLGIQEQRYGSFITQLFPFVASKLHLSLKAILLLYSVSFNLFYLAVIALLTFRYKQYGLAILMALYYTIFVSDAFYWTNNEVHQGIAWMFFCLGVLFWKNERKVASWQYAATVILFGGLAIFTHPLVGIVLLYLIGFLLLTKRYWPFAKMETALIAGLFALLFAAKFFVSQSGDSYDAGKLHDITHTTLPLVLKTFTSGNARSLFSDCTGNYWWIFIIIAMGFGAMIRERKWLLVLFTVVSSVAYFVFLSLIYNDPYDFHIRFYMESEWMGLAILLGAPFVYYFLPLLSEKKAALLLAAIFATRLIYIGAASETFTKRVAYIGQLLHQMDQNKWTKVVLRKNQHTDDVLLLGWGLPLESMMLDQVNGHVPQHTVIMLSDEQIKERFTTDPNVFMSSFATAPAKQLNADYFIIDTVQHYRVVSEEQLRNGTDTGYVAPQKP